MTEKAVKYQVGSDGVVISMTTLDEQEYHINRSRVSKRPHWKNLRRSRWDGLKKAVISQDVGEWYVYDGFLDKQELKRANNTLHRDKTGSLLKRGLAGRKITVLTNPDELRLAVLVTKA